MLKPRLSTCLGYLTPYRVLYDVGTDHAYLPIVAVKEKHIEKAYAIDNKKGPLKQAEKNINAHELREQITPILSNGLDALTDDVDVVVIAGMGASAIYTILHSKNYKNVKRFILQPNAHSHLVRSLCETEALKIVDETVVEEDGIYYPILIIERGNQKLTKHERAFGPVLLKKRTEAFLTMLKNEETYLETLIQTIPNDRAKKRHQERLKLIKEVLDERNTD